MWQYIQDLFNWGQQEVENNPLYQEVVTNIPDTPEIQIIMGRAWNQVTEVWEDAVNIIAPDDSKPEEPQSNLLLWILSGLIIYKVTK
jgi:hypothetical protein